MQLAQCESHLCCGSAGTYSVLQPELSKRLRDRKLSHLEPLRLEVIVSANIGCIQHLGSGTATPVRHWVEVLDGRWPEPAGRTHVQSILMLASLRERLPKRNLGLTTLSSLRALLPTAAAPCLSSACRTSG